MVVLIFSRGSFNPVSDFLPAIDLHPFLQGGCDYQTKRITISLYLLRGDQDDIHGLTHTVQVHVNVPDQAMIVKLSALHHQQIYIVVGSYLATSCGAEEDYPIGLSYLNDTLNDLLKYLLT